MTPEPPAARIDPRANLAMQMSALPAPSAILFDLDGTLVDTVKFRVEAWRGALAEIGIVADPAYLAGFMGSDGRWLGKEVARHYGSEIDDETADRLDRRHGVLFDAINEPEPLPYATELLIALESADLRFAIATSSQAPQVAISLAALHLPSPPQVANGGHVAHAKPEPDLLLYGATQLGVPPAACWYIGDSRWDMMASERAGMIGVGVATGAYDVAALLETGAAAAVPDLGAVFAELRARGLIGGETAG